MLSGARVVAASLLIIINIKINLIINININLTININIIIVFIDRHHHYYGHWCYLRPGSWQLGYSSRQTGKDVLPQCSLSTQLPSQCFLSTSLGLDKTWQPIGVYAFQIKLALSVSSSWSWLCQAPWAETKQNDFGKAESSVAQREKLMACTSQNLGLLGKTKRYQLTTLLQAFCLSQQHQVYNCLFRLL